MAEPHPRFSAFSERVTPLVWSERLEVLLAEFHCEPDDPAWRADNDIGGAHHIAFPGTPVEITRAQTGPVATDRNQILLYDPHETYRRRLVDPRGDHCLFLAFGASAVGSLSEAVRSAFDPGTMRFRHPTAQAPAPTYLLVQRLRARARRGPMEPLAAEEALAALVGAATASVSALPVPTPTSREAVEALKQVLAVRFAENLTLVELADIVHVSPFHLHRTFRAATGVTIHHYREQLRLRAGVERVLSGEPDLAALAADLGFSSHSHFTARFRRTFGSTPSAVRGAA